jgi:glycosyltransferase involved in cell wall biosynthesis
MNPSALEISTPPSTRLAGGARETRALAKNGGMRVAHVLRKYDPAEWGGTETAIHRLFMGLREHGVESVVYCPRLTTKPAADPLEEAGCAVKRFGAFLPVLGISKTERRQHVAVGGNLMSLGLPVALWREPGISVIHAHALGRLGGLASLVARRRGAPLVVTIHGGYLDLPESLRESFRKSRRGWEWGKVFGFWLRSRQLLRRADAILTCNPREAALLREQFPGRRVLVQPHGVAMGLYREDRGEPARKAFPQICDRELLLCTGRIDPVKNQRWLVEEAPAIFRRHSNALLALAGACTDENYGDALRARIRELGLEDRVLVTGGLPPGDARLIGLFQEARAVLLPSVSETFGLVVLEAWAAGTAVIASRTSGATALIRHGENGWLFNHGDARAFHEAVDAALLKPELAAQFAASGNRLVRAEYDGVALAGRMKNLYAQLIEEKHALRHSARR